MRSILLVLLLLSVGLTSAQDDATKPNMVLFISDLHIGVGRDPDDDSMWHATEDFRWHDAFGNFLREMSDTAGDDIELVILGDFLELWQSVEADCEHQKKDFDLGCSEAEALNRMTRVIEQHAEVFQHLSWFVGQAENRISIVAGNHDVALAFPSARKKLLDAFDPASREKVTIIEKAVWVSTDRRVVAEHGQQIGKDPNKFEGWPDSPFIEYKGDTYLVQTWGESMVQELFNDVEEAYPIIDNLSSEITGLKYANRSESWKTKLRAVGRGLRFLFTQTSWDQARQILGEDGVPEWELKEKQAELATDEDRWRFLVESMDANDPLRKALETSAKVPSTPDFSLDEIEAICDRRWIQVQADVSRKIDQCEDTGKLGAAAERVGDIVNPKARDKRFREYLDELEKGAYVSGTLERYIYGHTHKVEVAYSPYGEGQGTQVYNDGAWQRTVTPEQLCEIARARGWLDEDVLEKAVPEDLPACYPFITAVWSNTDANIAITNLFWVEDGGNGSVEFSCTVAPNVTNDCL